MVLTLVISQDKCWAILQGLSNSSFATELEEYSLWAFCSFSASLLFLLTYFNFHSSVWPSRLTLEALFTQEKTSPPAWSRLICQRRAVFTKQSFCTIWVSNKAGGYIPLDTSPKYLWVVCPNMNAMCIRLGRLLISGVCEGTGGRSWRNSQWSSAKPLHGFSV